MILLVWCKIFYFFLKSFLFADIIENNRYNFEVCFSCFIAALLLCRAVVIEQSYQWLQFSWLCENRWCGVSSTQSVGCSQCRTDVIIKFSFELLLVRVTDPPLTKYSKLSRLTAAESSQLDLLQAKITSLHNSGTRSC